MLDLIIIRHRRFDWPHRKRQEAAAFRAIICAFKVFKHDLNVDEGLYIDHKNQESLLLLVGFRVARPIHVRVYELTIYKLYNLMHLKTCNSL